MAHLLFCGEIEDYTDLPCVTVGSSCSVCFTRALVCLCLVRFRASWLLQHWQAFELRASFLSWRAFEHLSLVSSWALSSHFELLSILWPELLNVLWPQPASRTSQCSSTRQLIPLGRSSRLASISTSFVRSASSFHQSSKVSPRLQ